MKTISLAAVAVLGTGLSLAAADWERFRGPNGSGAIEGPAIPLEWSSDQHLKWRVPLPGKGASSPIVSQDRVYVTSYTGYGVDPQNPGSPSDLTRHLIAFDRESGQELWRASIGSTAEEDPYQGFLTQHGYASSTPVADNRNVYVLFGKSGLFAFDRDGNQLWQRDLGTKSDPAKWGDGSSPILFGDLVIVDAGILGNRFVAIDRHSGEEAWSIEDSGFTNSWATPVKIQVDGQNQILFHVPHKLLSVDPESGEILWTAQSPLKDAACGSIVTKDGTAYLMGGRQGQAMAVRCGGSGDVSSSNLRWQRGLRAGITTPVIVGDQMYWTTGGIFFAASLDSGEYIYRERLPRMDGPTGGFPNADYSSPVAVDDRIIQFTRNGESYVIQAGREFKVLAHNPPFAGDDSAFSSTPAISNGELFVRSEKFLYCIAD